ncbi:MAG: 2,3-bisphosphoglycerate-dependent phosphoglycerate mutase [Minisyncoccia bacterium]|jgi:2,3-bisphosphoglycerate-dependent phosphoglycerate mutase
MTGTLIIARHHESEWNKLGLWTGLRDVHLTQYGFEKSEEMGRLLKGVPIDCAYTSTLVRAEETLEAMLRAAGETRVPIEHIAALNERDYGDYTGKNKWEVEQSLGKEAFDHIRRDWDYPIQNGETLKMVYERVIPFYLGTIVPLLKEDKNVLVVAHGNSLRALTIYIESIPTEKARDVEMLFGAVVLYQVDKEGKMINKETRQVESNVNA